MTKRTLLLPLLPILALAWTSLALAHDEALVDELTGCFEQLAVQIDTYVQDNDACFFDVSGEADGEAELTVNSMRRNELMMSTLASFTRMWSNNFLLEPTSDANTFRINPASPSGETTFVLPIHGGVYAYAYLAGAEAHMVRCNQQLGSCVIYVEIAEYTRTVLQTASQCFVLLILSFPEPEQDADIARYMSSVLEFRKRSVAPVAPERFQPACTDHRPAGDGESGK